MKKVSKPESHAPLKISKEYPRESNELYRSLFENSMDAILLTGPDGSVFSANPAACNMFGWSEEEICRLGRNGLVDNSDPRLNPGLLLRERNGSVFGELTMIRKNGDRFPVEISSNIFRDHSGNERTSMIIRDISERKQIVEALRESELRFQQIAINSVNWIWEVDQTGLYTYSSPVVEEILGYKQEEIILKKYFYDLFKPDDREQLKNLAFSVFEHREPFRDFININIRKNGGEVILCTSGLPILDSSGNLTGYRGVDIDITKKIAAEEKLRKSEEEYRNLFENSMIGISQATPEGKFLRINKAYAGMYGYPDTITMLNEINYNSQILYSNPDDRRRVLEILQEKGSMPPQEFMLKRRNGEYFWALVGAKQVMDNSGKLLYLEAEHIDISAQKNLEKEMQQVSIYTRNLIEASIDSLVAISLNGKITDVNFATEKITGIERKKLIGSDFTEYLTEPDKARKGFEAVLKNGVIKDYPLTIIHKSGRQTDVLYNATLFTNQAGEVQGIFAAARDITIRKKIEDELRASKKLLEKLNRHQNEIRENERALISREIHDELGQAMTALKLDLKQMHKNVSDNPEAVLKLNNMIDLLSNTIKIVQRISSELRPGILDDLGLAAAVEWYCDEFEERSGIKCSLAMEGSDCTDTQISLTIFRILQESLTNVIRHSMASCVRIKLNQESEGIKMIVHDNGIGIQKEKIESYQSMGLINMSERVKQFGGKFNISSKKGDGTLLTIFIPIL